MPQVFNLRVHKNLSHLVVRVDRATQWGNPFLLDDEHDRDSVCDLFRKYAEWRLTIEPNWLEPLRSKDLACWCKPLRCHGETLVRLANPS